MKAVPDVADRFCIPTEESSDWPESLDGREYLTYDVSVTTN
jgi:hypothetical protein